jgi:uncharacterized protein
MKMQAVAMALLVMGFGDVAVAQSFDCAKAQTRVEKLICSNETVVELDEYLGRYYAAGREALEGGAVACLQADQAQWLEAARNACTEAACLESAYLHRLGELDALQPGATALQRVTLPSTPALVWIVPPASDRTAAPPKPNARALEAVGTIVDEAASGDGFILLTTNGTRIPLVLSMFLEGRTPPLLEALSRQKDATFRVRGFAASDGRRTYFEPSRCTFIHRMPAPGPDAGPPDLQQARAAPVRRRESHRRKEQR